MTAAKWRGLLAALLVAAAAQLQVIGAGLPRTGTESLAEALTLLGYGWNTHAFCNPPRKCQEAACIWMEQGNFTPLLEAVVDAKMGFVVDSPLFLAFREFAEHFPEAKVVLTVRDDSSTWYRSFAEMQQLIFGDELPRGFTTPEFLRRNDTWMYCDMLPHVKFDCDIYTDDPPPGMVARCKRGYESHNLKVQQAIPKERLLVFNVKDGWEPLCSFLGLPVPSVPFPRNNEYVKVLKERKLRQRRNRAWWFMARVCLAMVLLALLASKRVRGWLRRAIFAKKEALE
uniref:Sulfotransferase domain-containing protein n=1 Tax=Alexandrium monilatum TaxID=311494 RepID=A0A7S4SMH0_9DINO